jgi:predicted esterase
LTYDTLLGEGRPWGFKLQEITFPAIHLWHGELDKSCPVAMGRAIETRLSHCNATYYPDAGHLSVLTDHGKEIVSTLTSARET